jgi:Glutaminase
MDFVLELTLFDYALSDATEPNNLVGKETAEQLFEYFKNSTLFNWNKSHNHCESRAEAICILLNSWKIPNYKAWVFSGAFLKNHIGGLKQHWNYHVAAMLQVQENNQIVHYVIDPATSNTLQTIKSWAENVTEYSHSYYLIKQSDYYIFSSKKISKTNWHIRNKQNSKWTVQGLASISALSAKGKAQLCFNKKILTNKLQALDVAKRNNPLL